MTAILAGVLASVVIAPTALAAPHVTGEFTVPNMPGYLTLGPDGNIWVAYGGPTVSRITPGGAVTTFDPNDIGTITGITSAEGKLWTTGPNAIGQFSPADPNNTGIQTTVAGVGGQQIVLGSDDNLWTTGPDKVFKVPPGDPAGATPITVPGLSGRDIDSANGLVWVADASAPGRVIRVTTGGAVTPFPVGGMVQGVAAGPGTDAAYANPGNSPQQVGRIQGGVVKKTNRPGDPFGITLATDGDYWTPLFASNPFSVGRLTTGGAITTLGGLSGGGRQITVGPDKTLWVGLEQVNKVARISGVTPQPRFDSARLTRRTFRLGRRSPARLSARRIRTGTTVRFKLSEAAKVVFRFEARRRGRRVHGHCRRPTRSNSARPRCVRYVLVRRRSFAVNEEAGLNKIRFQGKTSRHRALRPGRYRMVLRARDSAGNLSARKRLRFRLLPRAK